MTRALEGGRTMKATTQKRVLLAALLALAPAGAAWAAGGCAGDPHEAYHRALGADDPGYQCVQSGDWQAGAEGPSGPTMKEEQRDPFAGYQHTFPVAD